MEVPHRLDETCLSIHNMYFLMKTQETHLSLWLGKIRVPYHMFILPYYTPPQFSSNQLTGLQLLAGI